MENLQTKEYIIHGYVHGVCFRWFVQKWAVSLNVTGFVRNVPSGTVQTTITGTPEQHIAMYQKLQEGPPSAHITHIDINEKPLTKYKSFEITY
ncbi:acylphosphatase [Candidatus Margulisiibacteriota bacterium]